MCTAAIYKLYYCILFFSLSKHKANTTELHPKVRQTCFSLLFAVQVAGDAAGGDAAAGAAVRAAGQQVAGADPAEVEVREGRAVTLTDEKVSASIQVATKFRRSFTR